MKGLLHNGGSTFNGNRHGSFGSSVKSRRKYLLDNIFNGRCVAAYSLRKLRENYDGPCINVRRSSDNTTQYIYFDENGNIDENQLLRFCGSGNGFVRALFDQSINACFNQVLGGDILRITDRYLEQLDTTRQPQIVTSGVVNKVNGRVCIKFDGSNDYLVSIDGGPYVSRAFYNCFHNGNGFYSFVTRVNYTNLNNFKIAFGNLNGTETHRGFFCLFDDRASISRNEAWNHAIFRAVSGTYVMLANVNNALPENRQTIIQVQTKTGESVAANRSEIFSNNGNTNKVNTQTGAAASGNASNLFALGTGYGPLGPSADYINMDFQELIMYEGDMIDQRLKIRDNVNNYFKVY